MPDTLSRSQVAGCGLAAAIFLLFTWLASSRRDARAVVRHVEGGSSTLKGWRPIPQLPQSQWPPAGSGWPRPPSPPPPPLPSFRSVEAGDDDDPFASASLRRRPEVRRALRNALRAAMREAERNASADPLELLALRLLQRPYALGGVAMPPRPPQPPPPPPQLETGVASDAGAGDASTVGSDGASTDCVGRGGRRRRRCGGMGRGRGHGGRAAAAATAAANGTLPLLPYPPRAARTHGLPPKLPTAAMWPPLRRATHPPAADASTDFRSLGRMAVYRGDDLEKPGELAKAVAARSYRGELILTYGNEAGTAWIANLIFSLRGAGIDHSLVIVMSDEHCRALSRPPWLISCAWSSWDFGQTNTGGSTARKRYEGQPCKNPYEMRRLWYSRHHYMSRVIEETGLNVAVIDGDMSVRADR